MGLSDFIDNITCAELRSIYWEEFVQIHRELVENLCDIVHGRDPRHVEKTWDNHEDGETTVEEGESTAEKLSQRLLRYARNAEVEGASEETDPDGNETEEPGERPQSRLDEKKRRGTLMRV